MRQLKTLILGAAGFVGHHLIDHLQGEGKWSIAVTKMPHETIHRSGIEIYDLDILQPQQIQSLLETVQPDVLFHLAAQSSVALSWKNPQLTVDINVKGTLNLLDALRGMERPPRTLLIGSGEEYGVIRPEETPVSEENALRPGNLYAMTKAAQNMAGKIYVDAYGLDLVMVRAFNHIGPNQAPMFVVADFCKQVAEIECGLREPVMHVGNLSARRDFTDVRDVVRAYGLLVEKGKKGEVYNVGSGQAVSIQSVLDQILAQSTAQVEVQVDPARLRPVDVPVIEADIQKLKACTGWQPHISLEQTIADTLQVWRQSLSEGVHGA